MPYDPLPAAPATLGSIESHAPLLRRPPVGQLLYKVTSVENCIRSIEGGYLHFNRVDSYKDFTSADQHDGEQLAADRDGNRAVTFAKAPDFSFADYCDRSRSRTYAFCASLENSDHIWTYSNGTPKGNVGVVFDFDKLRAAVNRTLQSGAAILEYNGVRLRQIFDVNYGLVEYVHWASHRANEMRLPNPIMYTYMKDEGQYAEERELRISLSALGVGKFVMDDGTEVAFPPHLQLGFDFRAACGDGTIQQILCGPRCDEDFFREELRRLGAEPCPA
ncbi:MULTISPECIES: hypothetical protein [unclassified Bradyrhizobium]|uniref:hypothetical protein n=1 Tax=unclassified Bradyrhizobium TaxID=2631580 RepID=UPI0029165C77|nr:MULTISPECIES: hypothetical protein [unclassified Bradyrhizobium]